jgi:hypothetical protein
MTLYETIKIIEDIAKKQPNINNIVETGDIYDLNKDEYEQKYSAFCITQRTHIPQENFITYNFTLYYVDRLTFDKENKLFVQSTACEILTNIVKTLNQTIDFLQVDISDITTFTEKFTAECAGAFINVGITVTYNSLCPSIFDEQPCVKIPGEFNENQFSTDFFLYTLICN